MLSCIYTKDKIKKKKKWVDGFIIKKGSTIQLYDEDKKPIYKSSFKINEDSNIDVACYLIYIDDLEELLGNRTVDMEVICDLDVAHYKNTLNNSSTLEECQEPIKYIDEKESFIKKADARSNEDVLGLFK